MMEMEMMEMGMVGKREFGWLRYAKI